MLSDLNWTVKSIFITIAVSAVLLFGSCSDKLPPDSGSTTAPSIQWQKCLGGSNDDEAYSIQQTRDGGYIVAGYTRSSDGDLVTNRVGDDCWIIKLSANGSIQWQETLDKPLNQRANSIRQTRDDGYIIAGFSDSTNSIGGSRNWWIVKLNPDGLVQWEKSLGNNTGAWIEAYSVEQTTDDGYIVAGHDDNDDCKIVKLDFNGLVQWQKSYGGSAFDAAYSIQQTKDGGYIFAGTTMSKDKDVTTNIYGRNNIWVVKISAEGSIQWQKSLGDSAWAATRSIQQTTDGGYIIAGTLIKTASDENCWVVKLTNDGSVQWQSLFGGSNSDLALRVRQTNDGGYIIPASTNSNDSPVIGNHGNYDGWLIKLNKDGAGQWHKTFGGSNIDFIHSIQQTTDGGYIAAGSTFSNDGDVTGNHGNADFWIMKLR